MDGHLEMIGDSDREEMVIDGEDRDEDNGVVTEWSGKGTTDIIIDAAFGIPLGAVLMGYGGFAFIAQMYANLEIWWRVLIHGEGTIMDIRESSLFYLFHWNDGREKWREWFWFFNWLFHA